MEDPSGARAPDPSRRGDPIGWLPAVLAIAGSWVLFLPTCSGTMSVLGAFQTAATSSGVSTWQGQVCLAAYVVVLLAVVASASAGRVANARSRWIAFISASAAVVASTWLLAVVLDSSATTSSPPFVDARLTPHAAAYAQPLIAVALAWALLRGIRSHTASAPAE